MCESVRDNVCVRVFVNKGSEREGLRGCALDTICECETVCVREVVSECERECGCGCVIVCNSVCTRVYKRKRGFECARERM